MGESEVHARRRAAGRVAAWTLGAVLVIVVLAAGWIGVRGMLAFGHLREAQATATGLSERLDDPAAAAPEISRVADDTAAARALTADPVWGAAEGLPWIGPQLAAVATVAAAVDDVAGSALAPLTETAASFSADDLRPVDGAFDTTAIASTRENAETAAAGTARAASLVDGIDAAPLLPLVGEQVAEVRDLLHEVADATDALSRASVLLPAMLGSGEPRTYLVVFQNNAEWRSLGGIVGAVAQVNTEGGRMSLTAQGSSGDFTDYDDSVIPLSAEIVDIFSTRPGRFIQNATQAPDFAVAAQIAREMWARETGTQVDGVLSIDPVALSYLLAATGPVTLPTGDTLDSENAVQLLLNDVYLRYEVPAVQDAFFQATAAAVFEKLSSGAADPAVLLDALSRAGGENRLLVWNARADEQAVLDGTTLQGALPVTDAEQTTFGVYLNDGTGSKMDYYLRADAGTRWCATPDRAAITVRLRSDAPADAAALPRYITGGGGFNVPPGTARTNTAIYLPEGATVVGSSADRGGFGQEATDRGREVFVWSTLLAPGEEATATIVVDTPETRVLATRMTPTVHEPETLEIGADCELPE